MKFLTFGDRALVQHLGNQAFIKSVRRTSSSAHPNGKMLSSEGYAWLYVDQLN